MRSHLPWQWYGLGLSLLFALFFLCVWLFSRHNEVKNQDIELDALRLQVAVQQEELLRLRSTAGTEQNQVRIERSTKQSLVTRVQGLERENALLKEDMRLFERLIPVLGEEGQVRVENLRLIPEEGGRYRYRLMLAFQPSKQAQEFRGRLQFLAIIVQDGKEKNMLFPEVADASYALELKHFLRREGVFSLPVTVRLKSLEVRVFQGDTLKAQRVAQL